MLALIGVRLVVLIGSSVASYSGYCFQLSFFGDPPRQACSRLEYVSDVVSFVVPLSVFLFWWVPLAAFALCVAIGVLVSTLKREAHSTSRTSKHQAL